MKQHVKRHYIVIKDEDIEIIRAVRRYFKEKYGRNFPYNYIIRRIVREWCEEHQIDIQGGGQ
jgi:sulfur relay (sulfurtransferase) DsrC/TusE family protein